MDHAPAPLQRLRRQAIVDVKPEQYGAYEASHRKLLEVMRVLHREGGVVYYPEEIHRAMGIVPFAPAAYPVQPASALRAQ